MSAKNEYRIRSSKYSHPYHLWEDYQNGMFLDDINPQRVKRAVEILGNEKQCEKAMKRVLSEWKYAPETNLLSDVEFRWSSDRSWLGAACCNIEAQCTISEVRNAWWLLSDEQRDTANRIADQLVEEYTNQFFNCQLSMF